MARRLTIWCTRLDEDDIEHLTVILSCCTNLRAFVLGSHLLDPSAMTNMLDALPRDNLQAVRVVNPYYTPFVDYFERPTRPMPRLQVLELDYPAVHSCTDELGSFPKFTTLAPHFRCGGIPSLLHLQSHPLNSAADVDHMLVCHSRLCPVIFSRTDCCAHQGSWSEILNRHTSLERLHIGIYTTPLCMLDFHRSHACEPLNPLNQAGDCSVGRRCMNCCGSSWMRLGAARAARIQHVLIGILTTRTSSAPPFDPVVTLRSWFTQYPRMKPDGTVELSVSFVSSI